MGRMSDLHIERNEALGHEIDRIATILQAEKEVASERRTGILIRIIDRVVVEWRGYKTPCWIWTGPNSGSPDRRGGDYPRFSIDDQTVAVHRVLWMHFHGFLPSKRQLDHLCEVRMCINPDHFAKVTQKAHAKRDGRHKNFNRGGLHDEECE